MKLLYEGKNEVYDDYVISNVWILLEIIVLVTLLFIARIVYLLHSIHEIRQMKDPRTTSPLSTLLSTKMCRRPLKTLVVLGSGGHTTEMLHLIKNLNPEYYDPIVLVIATSDKTSLRRVEAYPHSLPIKNKNNLTENINECIFRIPRSREVGQSYWTSILTTMYSFFFAFWLVGFKVRVDINLHSVLTDFFWSNNNKSPPYKCPIVFDPKYTKKRRSHHL